jgi:hypothetical protein
MVGWGELGLADVHPDRRGGDVLGQPHRQLTGAVVVEAHPVEQRPVGGQPEQPRLRVARLCLRRDGADFGEPEPQRAPGVQPAAVLVETRRQAERPGERHPEHGAGQHGITRGQPAGQHPAQRCGCGDGAQQREHPVVDAFGGEQEQQPPQRAVHHNPG